MGVEFLWKAVLVRCVGSLKSMGGEPCWKVGFLVPRYFQWVAVAPKIWKRLGGLMSQQGLILGVDSNCSGGRKKRSGCVKKLRNRIKIEFSGGYVSTVQRLLNAGEIVVPTFQTSGLAGFQGTGNSRFLVATGYRGQAISTVNSLKTARNRSFALLLRAGSVFWCGLRPWASSLSDILGPRGQRRPDSGAESGFWDRGARYVRCARRCFPDGRAGCFSGPPQSLN